MNGDALHGMRTDQYGHRASRRKPLPGRAAVFVPEACVLDWHLPDAADVEAVHWRPRALAALQTLELRGYRVVLVNGAEMAEPGAQDPAAQAMRSAGANRALLQRLAEEGQVHPAGILAPVTPKELPDVLQHTAQCHRLDLRRGWFLSWEEGLGAASRRAGCRSVRLIEPGRPLRRRWPLLRGHVPMKFVDAAAFILRCDGHPPAEFEGEGPTAPAATPCACRP
ncbi:hypothetical protein QRD43_17935 [Pelomonas sp. APW6]|uniref:Uncharacterized protein n=1 Tax=Roseateles subflavus TaxID=3053353 RepID=A0ABT7LLQ2_9BURK|nr:hypothetical protein [Pelomonas sp. APW6]MDL5033796.1 hypothetical protein [Pelomonas sp. APW6]